MASAEVSYDIRDIIGRSLDPLDETERALRRYYLSLHPGTISHMRGDNTRLGPIQRRLNALQILEQQTPLIQKQHMHTNMINTLIELSENTDWEIDQEGVSHVRTDGFTSAAAKLVAVDEKLFRNLLRGLRAEAVLEMRHLPHERVLETFVQSTQDFLASRPSSPSLRTDYITELVSLSDLWRHDFKTYVTLKPHLQLMKDWYKILEFRKSGRGIAAFVPYEARWLHAYLMYQTQLGNPHTQLDKYVLLNEIFASVVEQESLLQNIRIETSIPVDRNTFSTRANLLTDAYNL